MMKSDVKLGMTMRYKYGDQRTGVVTAITQRTMRGPVVIELTMPDSTVVQVDLYHCAIVKPE